ncbi:V-type ATP synthase subunit I [Tuanshanicoccus lijuaniae]|uniref:V-type ATP synthase subunit I n=1 Tax=Aerococcaceae bacterium zg-1292 TaxID=2774330 RepID=UPI001BD8DA88|nr:V-type ATP synthase subunit I [Aerococcaceae bacterium zg-BR9]MBF6978246.1 V-type ATP synthase subunit I [Aerococcaceae bacterium zg-BR22]MBS4456461.1 V-type ATP synthase subunit I [Aerococcaceae bacterium zg-A91]MBS4458311.1 V-type ATP synthase subunit I [Aerococcaceae bacterium zg-BR33]
MAISQMQKVTIIAAREHLDAILSSVQRLRRVHVNDLQEEAIEAVSDTPLIRHYDAEQEAVVFEDEALQSIISRRQRILHAIEQLEVYETKGNLWETLTTKKPTMDFDAFRLHNDEFAEQKIIKQANRLTTRIRDIDDFLEKRQESIDKIVKWRELDVTPDQLRHFQYVKAIIGTIPNIESNTYIELIRKHPSIEHKIIFLNDFEYGLILFYQDNEREALEELMMQTRFTPLEYKYDLLPREQVDMWNEEITQLKEEREAIIAQMKDTKEALAGLKVQADYVNTKYARELTKKKLGVTQHLVAIEGWIEKEEFPIFETSIRQQFGEDIVIRTAEVKEEEAETVPVKLKNNPIIAPFELITSMYALPKYNEMDPTPFVMPFYFVFFGMMVADLGYGLLTVLGSLFALKVLNLNESTKGLLRFGFVIGISVCIWGIIYGSFFGFTMPFGLLDTNKDVIPILIISVCFGFMNIITALCLNIYLNVKAKQYIDAYASGLAWILLLVGLLLLGLGMLVPGYEVWGTIGKWLSIINAIGIVIAPCIKSGSFSSIGWGLYDLYGTTSYIGDLVSYSRLMALGLSGAGMAMAFNMLLSFLPVWAKFTVGVVLFILLHFVSMFLSMLSAYVHGARLIFVEFFSKFFNGGGQPFEPLTISEEYVTIKQEKVK